MSAKPEDSSPGATKTNTDDRHELLYKADGRAEAWLLMLVQSPS